MRKRALIELLTAVGIIAILTAFPIQMGKQAARGSEQRAAAAELSNVQTAVDVLMLDQHLALLPDPVTVPTNNMSRFPDWESDALGGYVLRPGPVGKTPGDRVYMAGNTTGTYVCTADGTVKQATSGYH
jgi:Tfp pilus assembly major pilin PilA